MCTTAYVWETTLLVLRTKLHVKQMHLGGSETKSLIAGAKYNLPPFGDQADEWPSDSDGAMELASVSPITLYVCCARCL